VLKAEMQDNNTQGYIEELSRHILYVHRILKVLSYATDTAYYGSED
jgi:hypothetical protein